MADLEHSFHLIKDHVNDDEGPGPPDAGRTVDDDGRLRDFGVCGHSARHLTSGALPTFAHNLPLFLVHIMEEL